MSSSSLLMMRSTTVALATLISLLACRAESRAPEKPTADVMIAPASLDCGEPIIAGTGIGALRIGTPVDSVKSKCRVSRDATEIGEEGMPARVLSVAFATDTVEAEIEADSVWRIQVKHPALRTADSLGVGTPLARLLGLPGVHGMMGEGALFVASPARCGLSFQLSETGADAPGREWTVDKLRRLPPSTVVTRVLIVGCTAAS